jgi:UDP-N-acetylglucosamine 3-dehydrogenase
MRVGVIGVGSMGQNHARVYSEIADLVGVADRDESTAKAIADRFHAERFADYRELLKEDLDAVSVATPTETHLPITMDVLEAGIPALVEKPLCLTAKDGAKLAKAAEDVDIVLAVGLIERHNPAIAYARDALVDGRFGDVITVSARRVSSFPERVRDVGVIMDLGIHEVDVMRHLLGAEVRSVYAQAGRQVHEHFEDYANILLRFDNGVEGFIEVNWLTPMKVRKLALTCTRSFVELDYTNQSLTVSSSKLKEFQPYDIYHSPLEYDIRQENLKRQEPLRRELEDFLRAVETGGKPLVDAWDANATMEVMEAAVRSNAEGRVVAVG